MKKILSFLWLLQASATAFAQQPNLTIHATIKDMKVGNWVYWRKISDTDKDSVKTVEGGFEIRATIAEGEGNIYVVQVGTAYAEHSVQLLYLDKGKVDIKGDGPMFNQVKLSGSPFILDFNAYNDFMDKDSVWHAAPELYKKANQLYKDKDSIGLANLQPLLDRTDSIRTARSKEWVGQHPASPISAYVLYFILRRGLGFDQLDSALGKLTPAAKNNRLAKEIEHSIAVNKLTGVGQTAMDFTQSDTAGRPVSLKDFRGKYVLVDFWASWCHPCRLENPNVVKAYADYKDKDFTVLGVSLDRPGYKEAWLKAIHEDGLAWTQVSDLKFWNNAIAKQYDIESIPSNLLIGPDGKIVAKDLHGDELEKKLSEVLPKKFVLTGTVDGQQEGMVHLSYALAKGKYVQDSAVLHQGAFRFTGMLSEPTMAWFYGKVKSRGTDDPNATDLFIEPGNLELTLKVNDFKHAILKGSASQDEYRAMEDAKVPVEVQYRSQLDSMMKEKDHEKAAAIRERLSPYFAAMRQKDYEFFDAHPRSAVTAYMLRFHVGDLSLDSLELFYDRLGEKGQQSASGKDIAVEIQKLRAGSPGSIAKDFTAKDIDGQPVALSAFKGKAYVLIDFWASWCVPCRHSNPHMIELFHQYHDKGFDVIGVSDDDGHQEAWKKAVAADGVGIWHNVLRGLDWDKLRKGEPNENDISEKYGIHSLPTKILIDKEGKIIGRYGEGRDDEDALDKKLAGIF